MPTSNFDIVSLCRENIVRLTDVVARGNEEIDEYKAITESLRQDVRAAEKEMKFLYKCLLTQTASKDVKKGQPSTSLKRILSTNDVEMPLKKIQKKNLAKKAVSNDNNNAKKAMSNDSSEGEETEDEADPVKESESLAGKENDDSEPYDLCHDPKYVWQIKLQAKSRGRGFDGKVYKPSENLEGVIKDVNKQLLIKGKTKTLACSIAFAIKHAPKHLLPKKKLSSDTDLRTRVKPWRKISFSHNNQEYKVIKSCVPFMKPEKRKP